MHCISSIYSNTIRDLACQINGDHFARSNRFDIVANNTQRNGAHRYGDVDNIDKYEY